jgi:subtilase family serine protease
MVLPGMLLLGLLVGCQPDLIPVQMPDLEGPFPFCRLEENQLVVRVQNAGNADAGEFNIQVDFLPGGSITAGMPAIPAGESADSAPIEFPVECFDSDCDFEITVDSGQAVDESNEDNNTVEGMCLG